MCLWNWIFFILQAQAGQFKPEYGPKNFKGTTCMCIKLYIKFHKYQDMYRDYLLSQPPFKQTVKSELITFVWGLESRRQDVHRGPRT